MKYQINILKNTNPQLAEKLRKYCYDLNGCCHEVHSGLGPYLNEYMYQEALEIVLKEKGIPFEKEYYFSAEFHGRRLKHKHYIDFFVRDKVIIACKAVEELMHEHRQQLWNYMRLTQTHIGILYNFAPVRDQNEHYYLDTENQILYTF